MSRLASFHHPSSPSPTPVKHQRSPASTPSKTPPTESTFHRRTRQILLDFRSVAATWDDLVLIDGLRAAKALVDTRTDLDNALAALPPGTLPATRIVTPQIESIELKIAQLDAVVASLRKQFAKLAVLADSLDALIGDAHRAKGWHWVTSEPLWHTWTLEKFASSLPVLLPFYHQALHEHVRLADVLRDYSTPFDVARSGIATWAAQAPLEECPWQDWDELFSIEVERWDSAR